MKRRTGYLFQRGAHWYLRCRVNGKQTVHALGTTDRKAAEIECDRLLSGQEGADSQNEALGSRIRARDAWGVFEGSSCRKRCSERTLTGYSGQFRALLDWLPAGIEFMDEISSGYAGRYAGYLKGRVNQGTWNKHINALQMIWSVLNKEYLMRGEPLPFAVVPWQYLVRDTHVPVRHKAFTVDQLIAVYRSAPDADWRDVIGVAAHTGLRRVDCIMLSMSDCLVDKGIISVCPRKTSGRGSRHERRAIMGLTPLVGDIIMRRQKQGGVFLFPALARTYNERPWEITETFQRYLTGLKDAGGEALFQTRVETDGAKAACVYGFHSFRHTYKSLMIEANVHPDLINLMLCHGQGKVEAGYVHAKAELLVNAARKALPELRDTGANVIRLRATA